MDGFPDAWHSSGGSLDPPRWSTFALPPSACPSHQQAFPTPLATWTPDDVQREDDPEPFQLFVSYSTEYGALRVFDDNSYVVAGTVVRDRVSLLCLPVDRGSSMHAVIGPLKRSVLDESVLRLTRLELRVVPGRGVYPSRTHPGIPDPQSTTGSVQSGSSSMSPMTSSNPPSSSSTQAFSLSPLDAQPNTLAHGVPQQPLPYVLFLITLSRPMSRKTG